jgi:hypothetical protein
MECKNKAVRQTGKIQNAKPAYPNFFKIPYTEWSVDEAMCHGAYVQVMFFKTPYHSYFLKYDIDDKQAFPTF